MNSSTQLARYLLRQLIENGVKEVVLSPGSRNAPLSIALYAAEQKGLITLHTRIDERTAGFFALGIAKAALRPVAVVCTSGTAVANYHPAVLEARHSQIPLLVITADRPASFRETGANQTTLQAGIFGNATTYAIDVSDPAVDLIPVFLPSTLVPYTSMSNSTNLYCPMMRTSGWLVLPLEISRMHRTRMVWN